MIDDLVLLRDYLPSDEALVYQTWLRGLYYGNSWFGAIPPKIFHTEYRKILNYLIPRSKIRCACLKEDPDVILGYSVVMGHKLHWIFVKSSWRRIGIAKKLIPANITQVSHLTDLGISLKPKSWDFNPFFEEPHGKEN